MGCDAEDLDRAFEVHRCFFKELCRVVQFPLSLFDLRCVSRCLTIGAASLGLKLGKFVYGFTVIFWLTYACVIVGSFANIAANAPGDIKKFNLSWSLRLTPESGLICALLAGLFISNFMPKFAESLKEAARPEWYIKTAIVILGAALGVKAVTAMGLATAVMFRASAQLLRHISFIGRWSI